MRETEVKVEHEVRLNTVGKLRSALEIIMDYEYAGELIAHRMRRGVPMDDLVIETVGEILASEVTKIDKDDKDVPVYSSYGRTFIGLNGDLVPHYGHFLPPELVDRYLDVRSRFPDAVINDRINGGGLTIERPNPAYDPTKGQDKGRNRRFLPIPSTPF